MSDLTRAQHLRPEMDTDACVSQIVVSETATPRMFKTIVFFWRDKKHTG
jgi:hypothetical protein